MLAESPSNAPMLARAQRSRRDSAETALDCLSRIDLMRGLPPEEMQALAAHVQFIEVPKGQRLFSQGDEGDALYFIRQGMARVLLDDTTDLGTKGADEVFGEMALLTGEPRSATVVAETDLKLLCVRRQDFDRLIQTSPRLQAALEELAERHRAGLALARTDPAAHRWWLGRAHRARAAQSRQLQGWELAMGFGFLLWALLRANETSGWFTGPQVEGWIAALQLLAGVTILQGACESFVLAVERSAARLHWDGFITGTIGSLVATLPEFVVIAFLVSVEPVAAFITAAVTIFNNAIAFSIYSFFLPKDQKGQFVMPPSLAKAGGEVLIAGSAIAMIVGVLMVVLAAGGQKTALAGPDLILLGVVLVVIYGYYVYTLVRYYSQGDEQDHPAQPPNPAALGHDTRWGAIAGMFLLGVAGSYAGGESIGGFADTALNQIGLPTVPTAAGLAFFAGISEYIIVWKAHRRGELGIALSNVFGGMTQVMFLLLPFSMIAIAIFGLLTGSVEYRVPIDTQTTLLMLLLFPLFYVLLQYLEEDHTLSNLDAAAMTGIYALLLYFLFTAPPHT